MSSAGGVLTALRLRGEELPRRDRLCRSAHADGGTAAARTRDRGRAGTGGDGRGAAGGLPALGPLGAGLRRLSLADRRRADDLSTLDRRRDLPGAGVGWIGAGPGGRHRFRLFGGGALAARRPRRQRRASSVALAHGGRGPRVNGREERGAGG